MRNFIKITVPKEAFVIYLLSVVITAADFIFYLIGSVSVNDMADSTVSTAMGGSLNVGVWFYYLPAAIGYAALLLLLPFFIFYILPFVVCRRHKVALGIYIAIAVLLQLLAIVDGYVLPIYKFHINASVLEMALKGGSNIFVFESAVVIRFVLVVLLAAVLPYVLGVISSKRLAACFTKKSILRTIYFLVLCNVVLFSVYSVSALKRGRSDYADAVMTASKSIPLFPPSPLHKVISKYVVQNLDEVDKAIFTFNNDRPMQYPLHPITASDSIAGYNVIYILIDAWNPSTYNSENTPNIYRFANGKANYFADHSACAHWTREGTYNLFFGFSSHYHEQTDVQDISPLFIDRMMSCGYNMQAFPSAGFGWPPLGESIFKRVKGLNNEIEGKSVFDRDNKITDMAIDYINGQKDDKPFFAFLFYDLAHAISIPQAYRTKFTPSMSEPDYTKLSNNTDPTQFFNLYRNCIFHIDELIGRVLKSVEDKGLLDKTIIVITSDHGQEFNETKKNYWGHGSNYSDWQTKVPLIVYYPGIDSGKHFDYTTTHFDIAPTILNRFMGVRNPYTDYSMGYDLYDAASSRYPLIMGGYYYYMGAYGFEDKVITAEYKEGYSSVTDKNMNKVSRSTIDVELLKKGIERRDMFYTK